jgi:perosamine synthetase
MNVPLSRPNISEREIQCVTRVLRTGQLSLGPLTSEFEEKFTAYRGTRFAVATITP